MSPHAQKHLADELLTFNEVADLLRVPVGTLRRWRLNGTGPAGFRVGKYVRFRMSAVEQFLEERQNEAEF